MTTETIKSGSRVRIQAGAAVTTTGPRRKYTTARAQIVTVQSVYEDRQEVRWAGSGGYWCNVALASVQQISE